MVYSDLGNYHITKNKTFKKWDLSDMDITAIGKLGELNEIVGNMDNKSVYTDKHSATMSIQLGVPVHMERAECDGDPAVDCSYGLHVGATKYVQSFAGYGDAILVCLVNPAHVVAVPNYDNSKMRVSEYFPFAIATFENGIIDIIEDLYYENDYAGYEEKELQETISMLQSNQPIKSAVNAEGETRPMDELIKMLEFRLVDLK